MKFHITHTTRYNYSQSVSLCHSEARLSPRGCANQQCLSSRLQIAPEPADYRERLDFFGNRVAYFAVQRPHTQLTVTAVSEVEINPAIKLPNQNETVTWENLSAQLHNIGPLKTSTPAAMLEARLYSLDSEMAASSADLRNYASASFKPGLSIAEVALNLTQRIYRDFNYDPSFTTIATPLATVLAHKRGVCQDFAHLAIACFRSFGLPARYVSGYIETEPPPGQVKLAGSDASHAWFSVFIPGTGWLDFDPTNNCQAGEQHVTLAWGRDYSDVTPLKGLAVGGSKHQVSVSVDVVRKT
ncbi:transglutaminase family protein [Methylomarinum vadi]|uniref:transglutaminase family protein n=1 Tax=Methylomarinum vadi TaxID=438855 RepID=UPI0004DF23EF|nr:transglutaminase family protein [Methylomarinum vadi]